MSHKSIMRQIRKYEKLKSETEEELKIYEKRLENLLDFKSRFISGKEEFDYNINHRRVRAENVGSMSKHIKSGQAYCKGMLEDLTGEKYQMAIKNINSISDSIEIVIKCLEEKIEDLKAQIAEYDRIIEDLYDELDRDDD